MAGPDSGIDPELMAIRERMMRKIQQQAEQVGAEGVVPRVPLDVDDSTFDRAVVDHPVVLVDLWAPWCGPCRIVGPILEEVAAERAGRVVVAKVNVDESPGIAGRFQVQGIPTLLLFKRGRLVDQVTGAMRKEQLDAWLDRHL